MITEYKGTPAPWVIYNRNYIFNSDYVKYKNSKKMVISCHLYTEEDKRKRQSLIESEENRANQLLISKAPELLDFIQKISGELLRNDFVLDEKWYNEAQELLIKTTNIS